MRVKLRSFPAGPPWSESADDADANECTVERVVSCRLVGVHRVVGQMLSLLQTLVRRALDHLHAPGAICAELARLQTDGIRPSADGIYLTMTQLKVRVALEPDHVRRADRIFPHGAGNRRC